MTFKNILLLSLSLFTMELSGQSTDGWLLVFEDNFDGNKLNDAEWAISNTGGDKCRILGGENETLSALAYPDGVVVENGLLKLRGEKMPLEEPINERCICTDQKICSKYYDQLPAPAQAACDAGTSDICDLFPVECDQIEMADGQPNRRNFPWRTGIVETKRKWQYGKYEIRFRFPGFDIDDEGYEHLYLKGQGQSAAFWFWGQGTEIDVFELDQSEVENMSANLHVFTDGNDNGSIENFSYNYLTTNCGANFTQPNHKRKFNLDELSPDSEGFFTMGIEWYPEGTFGVNVEVIKFYINGQIFFTGTFNKLKDLMKWGCDFWIPKENAHSNPMHLILSAGPDIVCKEWDENGICTKISKEVVGPPNHLSVFPFGMDIDYVKIWKYIEDKSVCSDDFIENADNSIFWEIYSPLITHPDPAQRAELKDGLVVKNDIIFGNGVFAGNQDFFFIKAKKNNNYLSGEINQMSLFGCDEIILRPNIFKVERGAFFNARIIDETKIVDYCDEAKISPNAPPGTYHSFLYNSENGFNTIIRCADFYTSNLLSISGASVEALSGSISDGDVLTFGKDLAAGTYHLSLTLSFDGGPNQTFYYLIQSAFFYKDDVPEVRFNNNNSESLFSVYPSLFEDNITIRFLLENAGNVSSYLVDLSGVKVRLDNNFHSAGEYSKNYDLSGLADGAYFFVLETANGIKRRKIIKISK